MSDAIALDYGAFLVGGLVAFTLTGMMNVQTYAYYRLYPKDGYGLKQIVAIVWFVDLLHSAFLGAALWRNIIMHFGDPFAIDVITWPLALTVACTAVVTLIVHCFFAYRIYMFSFHNWFIVGPLLFFNLVRFACATTTTVEMLHYGRYTLFKAHVRWLATLGLSLSSSIDIIVMLSLWYYLHKSRTQSMTLNHVIDSLLIYVFEAGTITCACTTITMICWVTLPDFLVFMGFHFLITKLFANSLMVTLNSRAQLRMQALKTPLTSFQVAQPTVTKTTQSSKVTESTIDTSFIGVESRMAPSTKHVKTLEIPEEVELAELQLPLNTGTYHSAADKN